MASTGVEFERPYPVTELTTERSARCSTCGPESPPKPAAELVAVLHRVARNKDGVWRVYCAEHRARAKEFNAPPPPPVRKAPAREPVATPRIICPGCFLEAPPTRWCDNCEIRIP